MGRANDISKNNTKVAIKRAILLKNGKYCDNEIAPDMILHPPLVSIMKC